MYTFAEIHNFSDRRDQADVVSFRRELVQNVGRRLASRVRPTVRGGFFLMQIV